MSSTVVVIAYVTYSYLGLWFPFEGFWFQFEGFPCRLRNSGSHSIFAKLLENGEEKLVAITSESTGVGGGVLETK